MAVDPARVAQVQAVKPGGRSAGSGCAIGGRVILTAGHVVSERTASGDVLPFAQVKVCFPVGGPDGPADLAVWWACETTWLRHDQDADAALLTITDPAWAAEADFDPVRWGQLTGSGAGVPCEVISYPRVQKDSTGRRDTEHLLGHINPGTAALARKYEISVGDTVAGTLPGSKSPWAGASGGAVICGPPLTLVTGVVREDRAGFAHGRLTATPVRVLARDETFRSAVRAGTGRDLLVESAELSSLFTSPHPRADLPSPSFLLRADVEAVGFRGRDELLGQLQDWCAGREPSVCLLTGPGGQGKTRLARRLVTELCRAGWAGGELAGIGTVPESGLARLADTAIPLLVVIDQADVRPEVARSVAERLAESGRPAPARILLLARESGEWWQRLTASSPAFADAREYRLGLLDEDVGRRHEAFSAAVSDLAARLGRVPGYRETDWPAVARTVSPPGIVDDGDRPASALAVQLMALSALLGRGPRPPAPGAVPHGQAREASPEDTLLAQEQGYWEESAARFGLRLNPHTLKRAVATAVMFGAESRQEALETLARVEGLHDARYDERETAAQWIRELYPAPATLYWGSLQPDRIAEHLVATVLQESPDLLGRSLPEAAPVQQRRALLVFIRCEAPYKQRWFTLSSLLATHWAEIAASVIAVAVSAEDPRPLPEALLTFLQQQPDLTRDQLAGLSAAIPRPARWLRQVTVQLTGRIAELSQDQPELAAALGDWSGDLAAMGQTSDARRAAGRAVNICQELVRPQGRLRKHGPPPETLDLQQRVLRTFADRMDDLGLPGVTIGPLRDAVAISRGLATADPAYRLSYASATEQLSRFLNRSGDCAGGLEAARQAADLYGQLADGEQRSAGQARALQTMSTSLSGLERTQEAIAAAGRAATAFRALADAGLGTYLPELADAYLALTVLYMKAGQYEEACEAAEENVRCRRRLSGNPSPPYVPVPYLPPDLPKLSAALYMLSRLRYQLGETEAALDAARAAAVMDEDLAAPIFGSRQHLPNLVVTTVWLGRMLQASEQPEQAATALVTGFRLAGQVGPDSLATDAATALRALYSRDASVVETAWRKAAGQEPLPAGLRVDDP